MAPKVKEKQMHHIIELKSNEELSQTIAEEKSGEMLGKADVVIITGVTLINHTLEDLLASTQPGVEVAVMGPGAAVPLCLFKIWATAR